jgi:hypothetical protein
VEKRKHQGHPGSLQMLYTSAFHKVKWIISSVYGSLCLICYAAKSRSIALRDAIDLLKTNFSL